MIKNKTTKAQQLVLDRMREGWMLSSSAVPDFFTLFNPSDPKHRTHGPVGVIAATAKALLKTGLIELDHVQSMVIGGEEHKWNRYRIKS